MKSQRIYRQSKISLRVVFGASYLFGITVFASIILKVAGVISDATPIVMSAFGAAGIALVILGIYTIKESLLIRKAFIVTTAEVIDNLMTIAGRAIKITFTHNHEAQTATVVRPSGYIEKGTKISVLYDPNQPAVVYVYGFRYFFNAATPVIGGFVFIGLASKYFVG